MYVCNNPAVRVTHLYVLGQTGGPARLAHVRVETVPGCPVGHPRSRYDHHVLDSAAGELGVQRQYAAVALVHKHNHTARQTVRYVAQELLGRVNFVTFHLKSDLIRSIFQYTVSNLILDNNSREWLISGGVCCCFFFFLSEFKLLE